MRGWTCLVVGLMACGRIEHTEVVDTEAQPACAARADTYRAIYTPIAGNCGTPASVDVSFYGSHDSSDCKVERYGYTSDFCTLTHEETCKIPGGGAVHFVELSVGNTDASELHGSYEVDLTGTDHDCKGTFRVSYTRR